MIGKKMFFFSIILLAGCITIVIGLVNMEHFSLGSMAFLFAAVSPYLFSTYLLKVSTEKGAVIVASLISLLIAIGGVSLLIYAMYVHKDAQSALAFVVIPVYQWGLLIVGVLILYFINKK